MLLNCVSKQICLLAELVVVIIKKMNSQNSAQPHTTVNVQCQVKKDIYRVFTVPTNMRICTFKVKLQNDLVGYFTGKTKIELRLEGTDKILGGTDLKKRVSSFIDPHRKNLNFEIIRLISVKIEVAKMGKEY